MSVLLMTLRTSIKFLLIFSLLIAGCAHNKLQNNDSSQKTEVELYDSAMASLVAKQYKEAIKKFNEIELIYPFSYWSMKAKLMSAYSSYKIKDYAAAALSSTGYIDGYPDGEHISYAYYLRAMSNYMQIDNLNLDQRATYRSLEQFNEILTRFPDTQYAVDSKYRIAYVREQIAAKELMIAKSYMKKGGYVASIKRLNVVYYSYTDTQYAPEALYRLIECYMALGLQNEALKYKSLLMKNFPENIWNERQSGLWAS